MTEAVAMTLAVDDETDEPGEPMGERISPHSAARYAESLGNSDSLTHGHQTSSKDR